MHIDKFSNIRHGKLNGAYDRVVRGPGFESGDPWFRSFKLSLTGFVLGGVLSEKCRGGCAVRFSKPPPYL